MNIYKRITFAGLRIEMAEELFNIVRAFDISDESLKTLLPIFHLFLREHVNISEMPGNVASLNNSTLAVF